MDDEHESMADEHDEEDVSLSDEKMSLSDDHDPMSISEHEDEEEQEIETESEEADQLDDDLAEFSARRRSQLFLHHRMPHSKSDGHLLCSAFPPPQKRPRTPCFDESLNSLNNSQHENHINFESKPPFIRHSATYSGQMVGMPQVRMSSGRSFIERLKEKQKSKEAMKKRQVERELSRELPDDLVESYDIDCREDAENGIVDEEGENWIEEERDEEEIVEMGKNF